MASTRNPNLDIQIPRRSPLEWPGYLIYRLFALLMNGVELLMNPLQQWLGVQKMGYIFVLPNLLIFGIFVLFPMLLNFYYAFTGGTELFPQDRTFVGAQNFARLFDCTSYLDPDSCREDLFWRGIYNTGFFVLFQVGGMVLFSLVTALVLNRAVVGRGFFRGIFFYPVLLSPVVVALIWKWILQRNGILNAFLVNLGSEPMRFLLDPDQATFWVIFVSIWALMGFYTLILLAGLQSIPAELYEAASIDGAGGWATFWGVTLPLLMPTMFVVLVLSLIRAVQVFDQIFVLTGGGPGTATLYMVQYIYDTGFANQIQRFGLASAASVVLGVALLFFTLIQLWLGNRSEAT
ncbi:MAG TPA: sugar ABC transporter permease [Caldilineaceae bacterium]|nr:sugar ABC transporter permease [Caldilineaceae bacterium]